MLDYSDVLQSGQFGIQFHLPCARVQHGVNQGRLSTVQVGGGGAKQWWSGGSLRGQIATYRVYMVKGLPYSLVQFLLHWRLKEFEILSAFYSAISAPPYSKIRGLSHKKDTQFTSTSSQAIIQVMAYLGVGGLPPCWASHVMQLGQCPNVVSLNSILESNLPFHNLTRVASYVSATSLGMKHLFLQGVQCLYCTGPLLTTVSWWICSVIEQRELVWAPIASFIKSSLPPQKPKYMVSGLSITQFVQSHRSVVCDNS